MVESDDVLVGWRAVADATTDGVGVVDSGTLARVDERFAAIYGYGDPDDLLGTPVRALHPASAQDRVEAALSAARSDGAWQGEIAGLRADGSTFTASVSVRRDGEGGALVWAVREPAAARPDAPDAERHWASFENAPVPVGIATADRGMVYCNPAAVSFLGASDREAVLGRDPRTFAHPEDREQLLGRVRQVIEGREPTASITERFVGLDGEVRAATVATSPVTFEGEPAAQVVLNDVTDRLARERELERFETIVETVTDGVYALDEELRFTFANAALCEMVGMSEDELLGMDARVLFADDDEVAMAAAMRDRVVEGDEDTGRIEVTLPTPDGDRSLEARYRLHPEPDGEYRGSVGVVRDVTDRLAREREVARQRDELATLNRITDVLLEIVRDLVETASREAVERTVCERLAASDLYRFAWVGEGELGSDRVTPRVSAGDDDGYLAATVGDAAAGHEPAGRAMRTGAMQFENVAVENAEADADGSWRAAALERGVRSLLAVPIRFRETVYGVLVVYATRPDAFSERERDAFAVLGETVGFAINAIKRRQLLFADSVTELEVSVTDPESFLLNVSGELDCRLTLDGYVSAGDRWLVYLDVDGAVDRVVAAAVDEPSVARARVLGECDGGGRVELVVSEPSLLHAVAASGGQVRTATMEDGVGRLVVDVPADADVHEVVEQLDGVFATSELLARRERDREPGAVQGLDGLLDELTDRQRDALETAYRAGYFDWPRASTAEAVAEALDVAAPTFHAHLRKAEDVVFGGLFE